MLPLTYGDISLDNILVGCDECGRGPGSGPVVAGCVIWDNEFQPKNSEEEKMLNMVKDSKKVTPKNREKLAEFIKDNAIAYGIGIVDNVEIDKINILQATFKAMHMALDKINVPYTRIMVDGNRFKPYIGHNGEFIPHTCIVNGDGILFQIAAASIIAKVARDKMMVDLHNSDTSLQHYAWDKNKGYLTKQHIDAIKQYGLSPYHRKTFIHFSGSSTNS
jgi:ribonuclease HII